MTLVLVAGSVLGFQSVSGASSNPIPCRSAATYSGSLTNASAGNIGIGAIHFNDGDCTKYSYDAVLPAGQDTYHLWHWGEVGGFYVGPGYTAHLTHKGSKNGGLDHKGPEVVVLAASVDWVVTVKKN